MRAPRHHRSQPLRDDGFTLVEVIVAMFVIVLVMTAMLGVVVSSLTTVTESRQRQTATALATQELESLRALPYDSIVLAKPVATPEGQPEAGLEHVTGSAPTWTFAPVVLPGVSETLVVNEWSGRWRDITVDGVAYRVSTYVTRPAVTGEQHFNLYALVSWTPNDGGPRRTTAQQSTAFSPAGCLSTAQSPFAAPCQAYYTGQAGTVLGGISIANALDSTLPVEGFANGTALNVAMSGASTNLLVEQTASATSTAQTSSASASGGTNGSSGGSQATATVDSDPSSVVGQSEAVDTFPGHTSTAHYLEGAAGRLLVRPTGGDSGRASAAIEAGGTLCLGADGLGLATGPAAAPRPCASTYATPSGTASSVRWEPPGAFGFGGTDVDLLSMAASSYASRAVSAQLTAANPGACTALGAGPGALGCAHSAASRRVGTVRVGPTGADGVAPAGWDAAHGLFSITNLTESARAEDGNSSGAPVYTRSGTLTYWDGTAYQTQTIDESTSFSFSVPPTTVAYTGAAGLTYYVTYQGTVSVQPATSERTPATRTGDPVADCKTEACVTRVNGSGAVLSNVVVTIDTVPFDPASVAPPVGRFALGTNLGGVFAQASYKAAPNA